MNIIRRILASPGLIASPPVLVDVGASGGVQATWKRIAPFSIGVGFEPDRRSSGSVGPLEKSFRRWISSDLLVVAEPDRKEAELFLTQDPRCSSTLRPQSGSLAEWSFANLFNVVAHAKSGSTTLGDLLGKHNLPGLDWLKCDTQGTDLRIFQSLAPDVRSRVLVVEFEPGLIDAYEGEDSVQSVLKAMEGTPFWLAKLEVLGVPYGSPGRLEQGLGGIGSWVYRQAGPVAPGWANIAFIRRFTMDDDLGRREYFLGWVFATLLGQPGFALGIADIGLRKFGDEIFSQMARSSLVAMRWGILKSWPRWPRMFWDRLLNRIRKW